MVFFDEISLKNIQEAEGAGLRCGKRKTALDCTKALRTVKKLAKTI